MKVGWASVHLENLHSTIQSYIKNDLAFTVKQDPEAPAFAIRLRVQTPPTEKWSLILGDVINNYRSALDYVAWQLASAKLGRPPTDAEARDIQFPISSAPSNFPGRCRTHLRPRDLATIGTFQPFRWKRPYLHPLAALARLSNHDKHRVAQLTIPIIDPRNWVFMGGGGTVIQDLKLRRRVPLVYDAKAGTFEVSQSGSGLPNVQYGEAGPTPFRLELADGPRVRGDGGDIYHTLGRIGMYVAKVINAFAPRLGAWDGQRAGEAFLPVTIE